MKTPKKPPVFLVVDSADIKLADERQRDEYFSKGTWVLFAPSVQHLVGAVTSFPREIIDSLAKVNSAFNINTLSSPGFRAHDLAPTVRPEEDVTVCIPNIPTELFSKLVCERHIEAVYADNMLDIAEKLTCLRHGQIPKGEFFWLSTPGPKFDPAARPLPLRIWRSERMMGMAHKGPNF